MTETVKGFAHAEGIEGVEAWARRAEQILSPSKADQDCLDAVLCALVGYQWRTKPRDNSIMIGDLTSGYMIAPTNVEVRDRIKEAAAKRGVPCM